MKDDVDWKKLFIALTDGCLRNESTSPNLDNIHEQEWVGYPALTEKELKAVQQIADERYDVYSQYYDIRWSLENQ